MKKDTTITEPGPTRYETLMGGTSLEVELFDHANQVVVTETIKVRQLPIATYEKAFPSAGNELGMAALYADKPPEWVGRLVPSSYSNLVEQGRRVNADFFGFCDRQFEAQVATARRIDPGLTETIRKAGLRLPA